MNGFKAASESKSEFILKMTEHTMELFVKAIEETQPSMAAYIKFDGVEGEATSTRLLSLLTGVWEEPLADYYGMLKTELDNVSPPTWI